MPIRFSSRQILVLPVRSTATPGTGAEDSCTNLVDAIRFYMSTFGGLCDSEGTHIETNGINEICTSMLIDTEIVSARVIVVFPCRRQFDQRTTLVVTFRQSLNSFCVAQALPPS